MEKSWAWCYTPVIQAMVGNIHRKILVQVCLGKKQDLMNVTARAKKSGDMAQATECLPSKNKAMSSNSRLTKKNNHSIIQKMAEKREIQSVTKKKMVKQDGKF
jgi:hypothetical protein